MDDHFVVTPKDMSFWYVFDDISSVFFILLAYEGMYLKKFFSNMPLIIMWIWGLVTC